MKKSVILSLAVLFLLSLSVSPAFAGSKQRHQWQGVAIGLGAAILGNAILNSSPTCERVAVVEHEPHYRSCPPPRSRHGYCETRRIWVPPVYERVWNPAHYENGRWVHGQWIDLEVKSGYWREDRLWSRR